MTGFNLIKPYLPFIEAIAGSLLLGFLSSYFLYRIIKKYYTPNSITPTSIIFSACQRAFYIILPLIYFSFFAGLMNLTTTFYIVEVAVKILITIAFSAAAIKFLDYIDIWLARKKKYRAEGLNYGSLVTRAYLLKKILTTVIIFIATSLILLNFPAVKEIGKGILISASLIGGMLAFAAQKVFSNFFSGLDFILNKPMSVGDMVSIGSETGSIEKITLNQIHLRTWDMRLIIYPLSYFNENPFQNLSYDQFGLKGTIFLYADYTVDIENIRQALTRILEKSTLWDKYTNSLQVVEVNVNNMQLRAVVGAKNLGDLWNLRCEVREKLIKHIQQTSPAALPKNYVQLVSSETVL
jgi:small-conductance mechanosensitive channel